MVAALGCRFSNLMSCSQLECHLDVINDKKFENAVGSVAVRVFVGNVAVMNVVPKRLGAISGLAPTRIEQAVVNVRHAV